MDVLHTAEKLAALLMAKDAGETVDTAEIARLRATLAAENAATADHHRDAGHVAEYEWVAGITKQATPSRS